MRQKIILVGRLGRDPEMRYLSDGTPVTNFSIAVDDGFGEKKKTIWFRISAWRKTAEACNQYLSKGRAVYVEGRLIADENGNPKTFTRNDGSAGASFEVTATEVVFLPGGRDGNGPPAASEQASQPQETAEEDAIPF